MLENVKKLCLLVLASALLVPAALAGPVGPAFTWSFTPQTTPTGSTAALPIGITIVNTGFTDITEVNGLTGLFSPGLGNYIVNVVTGTTGATDLANFLDANFFIAPGDSFSFTIFTIYYAGAPTGLYPVFDSATLELSDGEFSSSFAADNNAYASVTASAVPEPSSLVLLGTGTLGLLASARRKFQAA